MKKATRLIAVLMMLCLICCSFASCNGSGEESDNSGNKGKTDTNELFAGLPEKDYNNEEVTFLVPGDSFSSYKSCEIMPQESSPLILNEKVSARNELVENRFGVKINEIRSQNNESLLQLIRTETLSTGGTYDIVMPYIPDAASLALENAFYELGELKYFDLDKACWDQNARSALSINHKNYFATGDISLLTLACTHAIVFNKDMIKEYSMEDPYELVNSGKWTIDKLREMATKVTADTDGTPGMSYTDTYGFLINNNFVTSMFVGSGKSITGKNDDDIPYIRIIDEAGSASSVFIKIFDLVNDEKATVKIDATNSNYYITATSGGGTCWEAATQSVANKLALFRAMAVIDIIDLGNYECNFGIVPIPKYTEQQDDYHSLVSTLYATCVAIPSSCRDPEMSAIVAQAMCEASTNTTKDAYFNVILKLRKIQDNESEAMLDKIFNGRVYDLGIVYNWGGTGTYDPDSIGNFMNTVAYSGSQTFASTLESISGTVKSSLEKTLEAFNN